MSTSSSNALALLVVLATACTSVLGIESTVGDRDRDGVADARDRCPDAYDPYQRDDNGDGVGDACGPCPALTTDLDRDGRDDACDGCVGDGAVGIDVDSDGVDDGCDMCIGGVGQAGVDDDSDGVDDGCDACVASGADRDQDGVDDRCDHCLLGPPHDEDGDGFEDACDVCPAVQDPDQQVTADGLGEACDPDQNRYNSRRLFDPFTSADPATWRSFSWSIVGDSAVTDGAASSEWFAASRGPFTLRLQTRLADGTLTATMYPITTGPQMQDPPPIPTCTLTTSAGTLNLKTDLGAEILSATGPIVMEVIVGGGASTCTAFAADGTKVKLAMSDSTYSVRLSIDATGQPAAPTALDWIEIIDQRP